MYSEKNILQKKDKVLNKLKNYAIENDSVRTLILIGSRVNPSSFIDKYSDYDVKMFVSDIEPFLNDNWLLFFDEIMLRWPLEPTSTFDSRFITRLVMFKNGFRIDFQIALQKDFNPSRGYDNGYRILADKDDVAGDIQQPTFSEFIINRPTEREFLVLVNDFFWDTTYVAKNLCRKELFYAKYMIDSIIRIEYLKPMIEWYISSQHNWHVKTGKHGRFFEGYLDPKTWEELIKTFSNASLTNNWDSLFKMIDLFRKLAQTVAEDLECRYPKEIDNKATAWCKSLYSSTGSLSF